MQPSIGYVVPRMLPSSECRITIARSQWKLAWIPDCAGMTVVGDIGLPT